MSDPYRQPGTVEKEKAQPFPLEKILTVSARDYCESVGKNLSDYILRGIHVYLDMRYSEIKFQDKIPTGTEVVVSYQIAYVGFNSSIDASATALIPKEKETTNSTRPR